MVTLLCCLRLKKWVGVSDGKRMGRVDLWRNREARRWRAQVIKARKQVKTVLKESKILHSIAFFGSKLGVCKKYLIRSVIYSIRFVISIDPTCNLINPIRFFCFRIFWIGNENFPILDVQEYLKHGDYSYIFRYSVLNTRKLVFKIEHSKSIG